MIKIIMQLEYNQNSYQKGIFYVFKQSFLSPFLVKILDFNKANQKKEQVIIQLITVVFTTKSQSAFIKNVVIYKLMSKFCIKMANTSLPLPFFVRLDFWSCCSNSYFFKFVKKLTVSLITRAKPKSKKTKVIVKNTIQLSKT